MIAKSIGSLCVTACVIELKLKRTQKQMTDIAKQKEDPVADYARSVA